MTQLALWEGFDQSTRPLPELISVNYGFPLAHHDVEHVRYYAVQDWIRGVAQSPEPRKFWDAMKRRLKKAEIEMSTWCRPLPYRAGDGKNYKRDHATAEGLYLITQRMDADTGIRDKILRYLARSGVALDEMRRDPGKAIDAGVAAYRLKGKDDQWISARIDGKLKRNQFTAALHASLADPQPIHFAQATDDVSTGLFARTTARLKTELGLSKGANLRDFLPTLALAYLAITEEVIAQQLGIKTELTWDEAEQIIRKVAALIRPQVQATSQHLGVDVATGRPLLKGGLQ